MPARVRVDRLKPIYTAAKMLNYGWRLSDFPSAPMQNGVSRFVPQLHRLTIRFCKQNEQSVGIRNFIENNLFEFSRANPSVAVYVIPGRNCTPVIRAEYGNGRMVHMNSSGLSAERVCQYVNLFRTRSGALIVRFESRQTAACKSLFLRHNIAAIKSFDLAPNSNKIRRFPNKRVVLNYQQLVLFTRDQELRRGLRGKIKELKTIQLIQFKESRHKN